VKLIINITVFMLKTVINITVFMLKTVTIFGPSTGRKLEQITPGILRNTPVTRNTVNLTADDNGNEGITIKRGRRETGGGTIRDAREQEGGGARQPQTALMPG